MYGMKMMVAAMVATLGLGFVSAQDAPKKEEAGKGTPMVGLELKETKFGFEVRVAFDTKPKEAEKEMTSKLADLFGGWSDSFSVGYSRGKADGNTAIVELTGPKLGREVKPGVLEVEEFKLPMPNLRKIEGASKGKADIENGTSTWKVTFAKEPSKDDLERLTVLFQSEAKFVRGIKDAPVKLSQDGKSGKVYEVSVTILPKK